MVLDCIESGLAPRLYAEKEGPLSKLNSSDYSIIYIEVSLHALHLQAVITIGILHRFEASVRNF